MNKINSCSRVLPWLMASLLSLVLAGCGGGGGQDPILGTGAGVSFAAPTGAIIPGAVCPVASATSPAVITSDPTGGNQFVATSTTGVASNGKLISATFSLAMNAATINAATFTLAPLGGALLVPATVSYDAATKVATLTTSSALVASTSYTAVIHAGATSATGTPVGCPFAWTFKTATVAVASPAVIGLGSASTFGTFGGTAGITNAGLLTVVNGDIGTTAVSTAVTGFHDAGPGCTYTETTLNRGTVNGLIYTAAPPPTVACPTEGTATTFAIATQARADALAAYNALAAMPVGANPGANLAGLTLAPGVYTAPNGSFMMQGGDLTLDAQGDANAVWVFQMATTLTVGGPGAAAPQSVILTGGAQAKNVFWQVGSAATINAGGGGTMVGTIIAQAGAAFSTAGNVAIVTLQGRALSLGASVTLVNTVVNVPQ